MEDDYRSSQPSLLREDASADCVDPATSGRIQVHHAKPGENVDGERVHEGEVVRCFRRRCIGPVMQEGCRFVGR